MLLTNHQAKNHLPSLTQPLSAQRVLQITALRGHRHHLEIDYQIAANRFSTKVFYYDVDLDRLAQRYSPMFLRQIYCHIALIEGLKFCSVFPQRYDITPIADGLSQASLTFFTEVYNAAYTQNKYENQISDYQGPEFYSDRPLGELQSVTLDTDNPVVLVGNGGGKDSFLSMKLLEEGNVPFAAFQWGRSEYGRFAYQHSLSEKLYHHALPQTVHRVSVFDDFTDGVYAQLYFPDYVSPFTLGTPECIFAALPILLDRGYHYFAVGNEKSADTGNLYWSELGQEVNHQWIKSYEAEIVFNQFIQAHFISNHHYFSLLKPIHDYRIFQHLTRYPEALPVLHSCNIDKPWCKKCAKCAYVWLNYLANFETSLINQLFQTNPFDDSDLVPYYRQLLGLEEHNAFECVGHVNESRMAMMKCVQKGLRGRTIEQFEAEVKPRLLQDWRSLEQHYNKVYSEHNIPEAVFEQIEPYL
jgi:hypothetical protein